jgi:chromosome segregation ATPase
VRGEVEKTLRGLEEEQKKGEAKAVIELRDKYKQEKGEVNALEKEFEREKAILENSLKRMEDLKKGKAESEKRTESSKREIDNFKSQQVELEKKVSEIIGKMTAY